MGKISLISIAFILFGAMMLPLVNTYNFNEEYISQEKIICINENGNTLYVGGIGPNNYTSIQDAIDNASDGDTIFVYNDSSPYYENVIIDKSVNLIGENRETTVIDGSRVGNVITIKADNVNISGFTIQKSGTGGKTYSNKGVWILSNYSTMKGNILRDNQVGVDLYSCSNNIIDGNIFYNNIHDSILLDKSNNNSIINNVIDDITGSIGLYESNGNMILSNVINGYCIMLSSSRKNVFRNNIMEGCGLEIHGRCLPDFWNDVDTSNRINGKPIYYCINKTGITIPNDAGEVILVNCSDCTLSHLALNGGTEGIGLAYCSNVTIVGNNICNNKQIGIRLWETDYTHIFNNLLGNNFNGLELLSKNYYNIIANNTIQHNEIGIRLIGSVCNVIRENMVVDSRMGIELDNSGNNTICDNIINQIRDYGISLYASPNNTISENTIDNDSGVGILLSCSSDNMLMGNRMNGCSLEIDGDNLADYVNKVDISNTVNGKPVYYYINKVDIIIPNDAGEVILINCSSCKLFNLTICEGSIGIEFVYGNENIIFGSTIGWNNVYGVYMRHSNGNVLINNTIVHNMGGIMLFRSNTTLHGNNICGNKQYGLSADDSTVDARRNWWGSITGPSLFGIFGDRLAFWESMKGSHHLYVFPWLLFPNPSARALINM